MPLLFENWNGEGFHMDEFTGFKLEQTISFYRGMVLDCVENVLDGDPEWPATRSKLLKVLGDRGLEGKIREIIGLEPRERMTIR